MTSTFARRKLLGILSGSWLAQACYAVAKLGLPDAMAAGPRPVAELAAECGADPRVLNRLLRRWPRSACSGRPRRRPMR